MYTINANVKLVSLLLASSMGLGPAACFEARERSSMSEDSEGSENSESEDGVGDEQGDAADTPRVPPDVGRSCPPALFNASNLDETCFQ